MQIKNVKEKAVSCDTVFFRGLYMQRILSFMSSRGMWVSKGRCLIVKDNQYMLVLDKSPYCMVTNKEYMFHGLENGDEILVLHGYFLV